jgi:hypothetical protein
MNKKGKKWPKKFAITKLPISFDSFDNLITGRVSYFANHETTQLSTYCRASIENDCYTIFFKD